jgi:hypothetical protein
VVGNTGRKIPATPKHKLTRPKQTNMYFMTAKVLLFILT